MTLFLYRAYETVAIFPPLTLRVYGRAEVQTARDVHASGV